MANKEVSKMALTKEQMAAVQGQAQVIGLVMAYYRRFGEDALPVAKEFSAQLGKMMGENTKSTLKTKGTDANSVAAVLNASLGQIAMPPICKVEGKKVIAQTDGFCPIMEAVKMLNAPWDKVDMYCSWPAFEAIALSVNPNAKMEIVTTRHRGDKSCTHVFTVP
jgi:hypothetical protein